MMSANNALSNVASSSTYLKSSGKLYDKTQKPAHDGLLCTLWNFPLRGYDTVASMFNESLTIRMP